MKNASQLYPQGPLSSCQALVIHELGNPVGFVLCQAARKNEWCRHAAAKEPEDQERVPLLAEGLTGYFNNRRLPYSGEVLWHTERLTRAEVTPALPPPGRGGMASALAPASRRMRDLWMKPELSSPRRGECPDSPARAQLRADSSEWAKIAAGIVSHGVCSMRQAGPVLRHKGQIGGSGAFWIERRNWLPAEREMLEREVLQLVTKTGPSHSVRSGIAKGIPWLPYFVMGALMELEPGRYVNGNSEGIQCGLLAFSLPKPWWAYFSLVQ